MRFSNSICFCLLSLSLLLGSLVVGAQQCGSQAGGKLCPEGLCCSEWGYCGNTIDYCCGSKCQSQCSGCPSPPPPYVPPPPPPPFVPPPPPPPFVPPPPECPHPPTGLEVCGCQAGGKKCREGLCCSEWGYCGCTPEFCCGSNCQSQCSGCPSPPPPYTPPPPSPPPRPTPPGSVALLINETLFNDLLKHKDDCLCPADGFYTYDAFIKVAESYPGFAKTGNDETRKREIAAFLAQTSHETTGGWKGAPDGEYAWGYCFKEEINQSSDYCNKTYTQWPCVSGKKYFGRGPIQISWNYNYGPAGDALGYKLLDDPDAVARDPVISFQTAIWFWMTQQWPKPSCHQVITEQWKPTKEDIKAGRHPGYGLTTNIINGLLECGKPGPNDQVENRIGFYKTYCDIYGISYGDNLDCYNQKPFGLSSVQMLENMHEDSAVAEF